MKKGALEYVVTKSDDRWGSMIRRACRLGVLYLPPEVVPDVHTALGSYQNAEIYSAAVVEQATQLKAELSDYKKTREATLVDCLREGLIVSTSNSQHSESIFVITNRYKGEPRVVVRQLSPSFTLDEIIRPKVELATKDITFLVGHLLD